MTYPRIAGFETSNPSLKLTQEQSFIAAKHKAERIRNIFLNSNIDYRHFYLEAEPKRSEICCPAPCGEAIAGTNVTPKPARIS